MRSIQAFSVLGIEKLYIGAPITTMSAARNSSSASLPVRTAGSLASAAGAQCGSGFAARSR